jgi:hypothetical protein
MSNVTFDNLQGFFKWVKFTDGTYIVDPAYVDEWRQEHE